MTICSRSEKYKLLLKTLAAVGESFFCGLVLPSEETHSPQKDSFNNLLIISAAEKIGRYKKMSIFVCKKCFLRLMLN